MAYFSLDAKPGRQRFDVALAFGLALLTWAQLFIAWIAADDIAAGGGIVAISGFHERSIYVTLLLATLCFLPLVWRRRKPLLVLALVTAAQCAMVLWAHDPLPTFIAPLIALYTVGSLQSTKRLVLAAIFVALALIGANQFVPSPTGSTENLLRQHNVLLDQPRHRGSSGGERRSHRNTPPVVIDFVNVSRGQTFSNILQILALVAAFAALGRMVRLRGEMIAAARARLNEERRANEEANLRREREERLRIARELHDITAHSLAAVIVQAGAAQTLAESGDLKAAAAGIDELRKSAKESLDELRHAVGVLRDEGAHENAPLTPEVSLKNLNQLLVGFRKTGLPVKLIADSSLDLSKLPNPVDIAAYRVIQESLTNALRHADNPSKVDLKIAVSHDQLHLVITNNVLRNTVSYNSLSKTEGQSDRSDLLSLPNKPRYEGHGIAGMRERVHALGGSFSAKQLGHDSFSVEAKIPLTADRLATRDGILDD